MAFDNAQLLKLYENLVRTRMYDQLAMRLLAEGKLMAFYHPAYGGEAPGVGGTTFLRQDDYVYAHLRGHGMGHMIGKGFDPRYYLAEHCGKATGVCRGLGCFHRFAPEYGFLGSGGTIGTVFTVTLGWGVAAKKNNRQQVTAAFFGDGTIQRGTWHEAANVAALWKLPIVYICENNGVAQYVSIEESYPLADLASLASGYGMPATVVDGQDVVAVAEAVTAAVDRARAGQGPSLIECKTARFTTHGIGNPNMINGRPRPQEEVDELKKRDPVQIMQQRLKDSGLLREADIERIQTKFKEELVDVERFIEESPFPDRSILKEALYAADE